MELELSPESKERAEKARKRVMQYIQREILPTFRGGLASDDEKPEGKNQ